MDVLVIGSGAADGWPTPYCSCASCTAERTSGRSRGQTAVLVDGTLLIDCGPEAPSAAQRAGADLTRLRHVLLTHQHPDHFSPSFLLYRSWSSSAPLDVVGPPEVLDQCRPWLAPDTHVRFHPVAAGDRLTLGRHDVQVLAARHGRPGTTVLYDVARDGARLLYATDTGPLPDETVAAVEGAAFDLVLLEETFGDRTGHGTDHLDLESFPEQLRRLAAVGAVLPTTDVVAVHLSHHNPPGPELDRRLAEWGARSVPDGTRIASSGSTSAAAVPAGPSPIRTLVLGGARSGKSREAERLLLAEPAVTYVATSYVDAGDPEWRDRVAEHRSRRPSHWATVETLDLVALLATPGEPLLVDCLTLWLTRVLDEHDGWEDAAWADGAETAVLAAVDDLVAAWRGTRRRVVAVSNEVGQGVVPATSSGRRFRDLMGRLNSRLAAETEDVRWCVAGRVLAL